MEFFRKKAFRIVVSILVFVMILPFIKNLIDHQESGSVFIEFYDEDGFFEKANSISIDVIYYNEWASNEMTVSKQSSSSKEFMMPLDNYRYDEGYVFLEFDEINYVHRLPKNRIRKNIVVLRRTDFSIAGTHK